MKFQFCGGINCPEWFIAEISVLTKITAVKMKLLFAQKDKSNKSQVLKYEKSSKILKLLNGTGLDHYQMCAVAATLKFILENSVAFHVNDLTLNKQLIDLGLPKQNVQSISKTYKANFQKLSSKSSENTFKCKNGQLQSIKQSISELFHSLIFRIFQTNEQFNRSQILSSNLTNPTFAQISLSYKKFDQKEYTQNFIMCDDDLENLIWELEGAMSCIQKLQKDKKSKVGQASQIQMN